MLARLRHEAGGGAHYEDGAVHARRTRDHVLHGIRMARAVDETLDHELGRWIESRVAACPEVRAAGFR